MDQPVIWLAGGVDKGNDYQPIQQLVQEKVRALVILGKNDTKLRQSFEVPVFQVHSMAEAVQWAKQQAQPGETVLLSPACASFDLFNNYEDRGDQFRLAVQQITI